VMVPAEHVVDECDVGAELPAYSGWNLPVLSSMTT
jgi:hypothetical protein